MKLMICGTRKKGYDELVRRVLYNELYDRKAPFEIIQGDCPDSADLYAKAFAEHNNLKVHSYPGTKGTYLKRNIDMVEACDQVIAFWDGFSYGTAHSIATAVAYGKPVRVVMIR